MTHMKRTWSFRSFYIAPLLVLWLVIGCSTAPTQQPTEPAQITRDPDVSGVWLLDVESPLGHEEIIARFEQSTGGALSGVMNANGTDVPLRGEIDRQAIEFDMTFEVRGQSLTLHYSGAVQGDAMSGTVQFGPMGTGKFSGRRAP